MCRLFKKVPDIATGFIVNNNQYSAYSSHFRIDFWMKAVPIRPRFSKEKIKFVQNMLRKSFLENHPNWHHEYKLVYCTQKEATHVSGSGVCGTIVALNDKNVIFDYKYIGWDKATIDEHRGDANDWAKRQKDDPYFSAPYIYVKGRWHF